jgi:hypothetical protein
MGNGDLGNRGNGGTGKWIKQDLGEPGNGANKEWSKFQFYGGSYSDQSISLYNVTTLFSKFS